MQFHLKRVYLLGIFKGFQKSQFTNQSFISYEKLLLILIKIQITMNC